MDKEIYKVIESRMIGGVDADLQFYGNFLRYCEFVEDPTIPTISIGMRHYKIVIVYNADFIRSMSDEQKIFLLLHEVSHVITCTIARRKTRKRVLFNIAADCVINSTLRKHYKLRTWYEEPVTKQKLAEGFEEVSVPGYYIPADYTGEWTTEDVYNYMLEKDSEQGSFGGAGFDEHLETLEELTDIDRDILERIVDEITEVAKYRSKHCPGMIEDARKRRLERKPDMFKHMKQWLSGAGYNKYGTYSRPNRRVAGIKGYCKQKRAFNVVLDTSGSMLGDFDKVLSYIYRDNLEINLIQCDTEVTSCVGIKNKKDLLSLIIKGGGGTALQPALQYIKKDAYLRKWPTVILTDGYTDTLNVGVLKQVMIISSGALAPTIGKAKQVQIK